MSNFSIGQNQFQSASPSFLDRLNLGAAVDESTLSESQRAARDEITRLQDALTDSAPVAAEGEEPSEPDVLAFVADQFQGENSDVAVAFLLDAASRDLQQPNELTFEEGLEGLGVDDLSETQALNQVLQLAVDTARLLRESDAPIGLRLDILGDLQNGLRDIQS